MSETSKSESPYYVEQEGESWLVKDASDRTVLSYRDQNSALHYSVLLNNAFVQGVKAAKRPRQSDS